MGNIQKKCNCKSAIIGLIFLIWFFVSLAGMLIYSKKEGCTGIILAIIGQYFLVFGIIAVVSNRTTKPFPFIVLVFPLVGISLLICGICIQLGGNDVLKMLGKYAPYILIWIFPIAGTVMLVKGTCGIRHLKRVCTREIQAKCIRVEASWTKGTKGHKGHYVYMPVYSIIYNGEERILQNNTYTNGNKFEEGAYYSIKINPDNPDEFMDANSQKANRLLLLLGIALIIITVPSIVEIYIN